MPLSVGDIYEQIKRMVREGFPKWVWVVGEIAKVEVRRGNCWIDLVESKMPAVLHNSRERQRMLKLVAFSFQGGELSKKLSDSNLELANGMFIKVLGEVSLWEGGSMLQLVVHDIDVEALLGELAARRERLRKALIAEGLLGVGKGNKALLLPKLPLKVGLVASYGTQGWHDFLGQIRDSGFGFHVNFVDTPVQGSEAAAGIVQAVRSLGMPEVDIDVIVIVRGGGSKSDLAVFDSEDVVRAVASSSKCVWTGIGHTQDVSLTDEVAHTSFITPTECGQGLAREVSGFWDESVQKMNYIFQTVNTCLERSIGELSSQAGVLRTRGLGRLEAATGNVSSQVNTIVRQSRSNLDANRREILNKAGLLRSSWLHFSKMLETQVLNKKALLFAHNPTQQLMRGWCMVRDSNGKLLRSVNNVKIGDKISTKFFDGILDSEVCKVYEVKYNSDSEGNR
ncbi:MAG: exodeoxyribonuclease VII large subunit [Actinobacteria bacterium]|nr:exodeoxyribonuclease VII large subunit [Actinomycetota bacterium]